jgi:hypothetical protein
VLSWDINADWQYDPELKTEIEVRYIADSKDARSSCIGNSTGTEHVAMRCAPFFQHHWRLGSAACGVRADCGGLGEDRWMTTSAASVRSAPLIVGDR